MHHFICAAAYDPGMSRPARPAPRTFSDDWPDRECSDQVAEIARLLAIRLKKITDKRGTRDAARSAGVSHSVISRIVHGDAWADTATLAKLELALDADLWPGGSARKRKQRAHT